MKKVLIGLLCITLIFIVGCLGPEIEYEYEYVDEGSDYCSYNKFDCGDFETQKETQLIYERCLETEGYDVHHFDGDGDGIACEALI